MQGLAHAWPYDAGVRWELGCELMGAQCWQEAAGVLAEACELAPDDGDIRLDLGRALVSLSCWAQAHEQLVRAVELRPWCAPTRAELGYVLLWQGRMEEAGAAGRAAVARDTGSALGRLVLAEALQARRRGTAAAVVHARAAVAVWPDSAWGQAVLAEVLLDTGDYAGARRAAGRAYGLAPGWERCAEVLCHALGEAQEWREAVRTAERAVGENATPWTLNALGWALIGRGRLYGAEQALRRAVALGPGVRVCRWNLAWLLVRVGRLREAEAHLACLLRRDPLDGQAHGLWGWIHLVSGRRGQAHEELSLAVRLLGRTRSAARALLLLGALERVHDPALARRRFAAAVAMSGRAGSPDVYSHPFGTGETRALALAALGESEQARRCLEQALAVRDGSDRFDPVLYGQFAHPPLPGLGALVGLWRDL
ncbi:tetratricopeptide repeat protein [Kitasatospora sp. NPDC096128]|uniref:tetratricopeptide repeat protein n=1 Tax=Kitasatospora sp. NPDC096128 TaxID=3155547 RepID=UPI00331CE4E1